MLGLGLAIVCLPCLSFWFSLACWWKNASPAVGVALLVLSASLSRWTGHALGRPLAVLSLASPLVFAAAGWITHGAREPASQVRLYEGVLFDTEVRGDELYVTSAPRKQALFVDGAGRKRVVEGSAYLPPQRMALDPATGRAYFANFGGRAGNALVVADGEDEATIALPACTSALDFVPRATTPIRSRWISG